MKLLITGGLGYLGARLAQFLSAETSHQIQLGSRQRVEPPHWLPGARTLLIRWESSESIEESLRGVDAVVHLAGMNAEDCIANPIAALECNAVATSRLLLAAIEHGVKRFIYLSTAHVYGSPLTGLITERTCPMSLHPYATSHRAGEDTIRTAHQRKDIEGIVVRLSNAFGAPAHVGANCWMLLVNDLCRQAVTDRRLTLRTSGLQRRDFIALNDACGAIRHLLELPADKLGDGLFNLGGGWSPTILEMTERIATRIHAVTGNMPAISRNEKLDGENPEMLDYRIDKLVATGFKVGAKDHVNREIDRLIRFCLEHFSQRR